MPFVDIDRRMNLGGALTAYDDDLPTLHAAGIRAVVSLLNIRNDRPVYESAGFDFLCLPIPDGHPPTVEQAREFVRFVNEERGAGKPVVAHCEAGLGRTGTMLAAYLISEGRSAAEAIRAIRNVQPGAVETMRQIQFLEEFERRGIGDRPPP